MMEKKRKFKQTEIGMIPKNWKENELGEELELQYGKGLIENKRTSGPIPVFGSNGIVGFHNEALVKGPGIIIGRKGSVGEAKFSKTDFWPIDTTYYVKLKSKGDVVFWYYFLLSMKLNRLNSHSAVPGLNRDQVYQIVKRIPPLIEQQSIAKILSDLDSKIELNQQMNKTLEEIGKEVFKHWFIDFEFPNEEGKPYKSSGGMMVYSEEFRREIPTKWKLGSILDCANILSGGTPSTEIDEYWQGEIPWVSASDVANAHGTYIINTERTISQSGLDNSPAKLLPRNTTVVTARGTVGSYCILSREMAINQTNYGLKAKNNSGDFFVFFSIANLVNQMKQHSYGTIFDTITTKTFGDMKIPIPPEDLIRGFNKIVFNAMNRMLVNIQESATLASIRDRLLPKLTSGKIRVPVEAG